MKQSVLWLGVSAFARVLARPIYNSYDYSPYVNIDEDSSSFYNSFTVAETPGEPTTPPSPKTNGEALKERVLDLLRETYNGKYGDLSLQELSRQVQSQVSDLIGDLSKKSVNEGGAINWPVYRDQLPRTIGTPWTQKDDEFNENNGGDQNPSPIQRMTQAPLVLPGLTPANLFKFLLTTVAAAPEAKIGLTGMELAGAVFEALPGFLRELGGVWSPGGGHL